jgi:hypothetical protein
MGRAEQLRENNVLAFSKLCSTQTTDKACLMEEMVNSIGDFKMVEQNWHKKKCCSRKEDIPNVNETDFVTWKSYNCYEKGRKE